MLADCELLIESAAHHCLHGCDHRRYKLQQARGVVGVARVEELQHGRDTIHAPDHGLLAHKSFNLGRRLETGAKVRGQL